MTKYLIAVGAIVSAIVVYWLWIPIAIGAIIAIVLLEESNDKP